MKIKITYDKAGAITEREFENAEDLEIQYDSAYVKIQARDAEKCIFMVKADRFISAERIE